MFFYTSTMLGSYNPNPSHNQNCYSVNDFYLDIDHNVDNNEKNDQSLLSSLINGFWSYHNDKVDNSLKSFNSTIESSPNPMTDAG